MVCRMKTGSYGNGCGIWPSAGSDEKRDPRYTTSYGTGEMIRDALERGFRDISIAIGGSATNDGGIGCIRALGGRFLDENGEELKGCGGDLIKIKKIDISD